MLTIRRLNIGEAAVYRKVRLEALRDSPEAFATSYESALKRDEESWISQADGSAAGDDRATFLVLINEEPVGMAALYRDAEGSSVGELIQMWISPAHRGSKMAAELLEHLFAWAAGCGITTIRAEVTEGNTRALRFYERQGFRKVDGNGVMLVREVSGLRGSDILV